MLMATTLMSTMTSMTTDFLLDNRDGLWEVACAPHSWLTEACEQQGLRPRRINLTEGGPHGITCEIYVDVIVLGVFGSQCRAPSGVVGPR